jgi:hypothetical protein
MREHNLYLKWSVSKGKYSYGENILTLIDGDKKYKACGGGYDMQGKVFGQWLAANYLKNIIDSGIKPTPSGGVKPFEPRDFEYGFFCYDGEYYLDGACGLECMISIAKKIGFKVRRVCNNEGHLTNIIVETNLNWI